MVTQASHKEIFADLDALLVEDSYFKYNGRIWRIRPISTLNFFQFSNATANINVLLGKDRKKATVEEVDNAYVDFFTSCIEDMTREDILKMNMIQRAALMNGVVDHVQGRVQGASGKKFYPRIDESGKFTYRLRG